MTEEKRENQGSTAITAILFTALEKRAQSCDQEAQICRQGGYFYAAMTAAGNAAGYRGAARLMQEALSSPGRGPIPLSNGVLIYAWACPRCHHVAAPPVKIGRHSETDICEMANHSFDTASACCLCHRCRAPVGTPMELYCEGCAGIVSEEAAAEQADAAAKQAAAGAALDAHMEEQLSKARDRGAALRLLEAMREISQTCYCAGWIDGLERSLWTMVCGGERKFGQGIVERAQVGNLHDLAELAGGWWVWQDGHVFEPLSEENFPARPHGYRVMARFEWGAPSTEQILAPSDLTKGSAACPEEVATGAPRSQGSN